MHAARLPTPQIEAFPGASWRSTVLLCWPTLSCVRGCCGSADGTIRVQAAAVAWDAQVGNAIAALKMIESSLPAGDSIDEGAILEVGGGAGTAARLAAATGPADHLA